MQENPLWPVKERFPSLKKDEKTDILVVGAGIAGISCASFLEKAGYNVTVIEKDEIGTGATGASSGILWYGSGPYYTDSAKDYGKENATVLWKETEKTIREMIETIQKERLVCGLRMPGAVAVAKNPTEEEFLEKEHKALRHIGIFSRLVSGEEIRDHFRSQIFSRGLEFEICSQIHPAQFTSGLARAGNLEVYEKTEMMSFKEQGNEVIVETAGGKITCSTLIVATNLQPFFGMEKHYGMESSVLLASQELSKKQMAAVWNREKILWSLEEKYDILYPTEKRLTLELYQYKNVKEKLAHYYPSVDFKIDKTWGNSWAKTKDSLPLFGRVRRNIIAAIGMGDQGIVMGFTCGRKIRQLVENKNDTFLTMVDPLRFERPENK